MSATSTPDATSDDQQAELTADERAVFKRLADRYDDEDVGRICTAVLQSSSDADNEVTTS